MLLHYFYPGVAIETSDPLAMMQPLSEALHHRLPPACERSRGGGLLFWEPRIQHSPPSWKQDGEQTQGDGGGGISGPQQPIPPSPASPAAPHPLHVHKEAPAAAGLQQAVPEADPLKLQLIGASPFHRGSELGPAKGKQRTAPAVQHRGL